jgi:hypothetical protein
MTTATNGHRINGASRPPEFPGADDLTELTEPKPATPAGVAGAPVPGGFADAEVAEMFEEVEALRAERRKAHQLVELQSDPVFAEVLDQDERDADKDVARKVRAKARRERLRAGRSQVRQSRSARWDQRWTTRAQRARDRRINPDRRLTSIYRTYVSLSTVTAMLLVAGVTWMSTTVHDGLVGSVGSWTGYLVEPLASVLLIVSMFAQFTAVKTGHRVSGKWLTLDAFLVAASLTLNTVPWGVRYGWNGGDLIGHLFPPVLVAAAVIVHHLLAGLFESIFASAHRAADQTYRLSTETADVVRLMVKAQEANRRGQLPLGEDGLPSADGIRKFFTIAKERSQKTKDALLLAQDAVREVITTS